MKYLLIVLFSMYGFGQPLVPILFGPVGSTGGPKYCTSLTVNPTLVGGSDQTNFVTVFLGNGDLRTVPNGGFVQRANGADIGFYSVADYAIGHLLSYETVAGVWSAITGMGEWHITIPLVSHTVNTLYYVCFGDNTIVTDLQNRLGTWPATLLAGMHLANGSLLSLLDFSNNSYTFTNNNTAIANVGQIDGGGAFVQASDQYLVSPTFTSPVESTMSVWIKANTLASGDTFNDVIATSDLAITYARIYVQNNGKLAIFYRTNDCGLVTSTTGSHTILTGTWYHIAVTYDGVNGLTSYVNGSVDSTAGAGCGNLANGTVSAVLANDSDSASLRSWDGSLDEPRWYSVAFSVDAITALYNSQNNPTIFNVYGTKVTVP